MTTTQSEARGDESVRRIIPLSSADIGAAERKQVEAAIEGGWISGTGPQVRELERRLAVRINRAHVIATANGTLAIELALRALDIGHDDEVVVPALTFAAPASSVLAVGATPVLADVARDHWTLNADDVARKISRRTKAILAVDVLGHPSDYDALSQFGVPIIEDAAEAHGAQYKGRPVGSFGIISIFSFHANKAITTGEGGCAATDSAELADRMRVIANHGMRPERPYVHEVIGRNHRMTNLAAAVGLGQVERWDDLIAARNHIATEYDRLLEGAGCVPRPVARWAQYSCWLHTIIVGKREEVLAYVRGRGVDARAIWPALSTQPLFGAGDGGFPVAESVAQQAMWLPTFSGMPAEDVGFVAETVRQAIVHTSGCR
jgi:perosamine synthetase